MKKVSISVIAISLAMPALADNVTPNISANANSANCTESVLETTSGTSNLEANWTANTLNLQWTAPDADNWSTQNGTCTYDAGITVPQTNPSKTGYTFAGWKVRAAAVVPSVPSCKDISNETTCDNTTGCAWSEYRNKCGKTLDDSVPYKNCAEITDPEECEYFVADEDGDPRYYGVCYYNTKTKKCSISVPYPGTGSHHYNLPSSWCEELAAAYGDCDDDCNCVE